jgi:hypothetical protein
MNQDTNLKISQALGIDPIPPSSNNGVIVLETAAEEASRTKLDIIRDKPLEDIIIDEDFNEARENLKGILDKTNEAIASLSLVAEASEHPRAYEVLATLLKNAADCNDKLLNLSKQRRELTKGLPQPKGFQPSLQQQPTNQTQNNIKVESAVFVGTAAELDKILDERRKLKNATPPPPPPEEV